MSLLDCRGENAWDFHLQTEGWGWGMGDAEEMWSEKGFLSFIIHFFIVMIIIIIVLNTAISNIAYKEWEYNAEMLILMYANFH